MSPITDGQLWLRRDEQADRYYLQMFDQDVVAQSPSGITYTEAKVWARDYVAAHWDLTPGTGTEVFGFSLCDGKADAGGSSHYDHERRAWVWAEKGNIIHMNTDIGEDDIDAAAEWFESLCSGKQSQSEAARVQILQAADGPVKVFNGSAYEW